MIAYSKYAYYTETNDPKSWDYVKELYEKFPNSLIIKSAAIGHALSSNRFAEAEKLIDNKYHPHHHYGDIEFSSMEVIMFYACIAHYFAEKNELLKADIFIELAEQSMEYDPRMNRDYIYIYAKEKIMDKKAKLYFEAI